jgi:hypothetical protein
MGPIVMTGREFDEMRIEIATLHDIPVHGEKIEASGYASLAADCGTDEHKADHVADTVARKIAGICGRSPSIVIDKGKVKCTVGIRAPWC